MNKYMTIVIEYEGNPPIKNFHNPIPGMNVVKISTGDGVEEIEILKEELNKLEKLCEKVDWSTINASGVKKHMHLKINQEIKRKN